MNALVSSSTAPTALVEQICENRVAVELLFSAQHYSFIG